MPPGEADRPDVGQLSATRWVVWGRVLHGALTTAWAGRRDTRVWADHYSCEDDRVDRGSQKSEDRYCREPVRGNLCPQTPCPHNCGVCSPGRASRRGCMHLSKPSAPMWRRGERGWFLGACITRSSISDSTPPRGSPQAVSTRPPSSSRPQRIPTRHLGTPYFDYPAKNTPWVSMPQPHGPSSRSPPGHAQPHPSKSS